MLRLASLPTDYHTIRMSDHAKQIYVEIRIQGDMDDLWRLTQMPDLHQRWDLRFSQIQYLPKKSDDEPQRFLYSTRIGFGMSIQGEGESVGERALPGGQRSSALKFWSNDPKSLITQGSGYWKYIPVEGGLRFLTLYDYKVRFGLFGKAIDWLIFRPLMGWATAWSFDRLRLWLEHGIPPEVSVQRSLVHALTRFSAAFVWIYHGLIPKLLFLSVDEIKMMLQASVPPDAVPTLISIIGWLELGFGLSFLVFCKARWPFWASIILMLLALLGVAIHSPAYLTAAFNPVTLNLLLISICAIGLLSGSQLPSANRCLRQPPKPQSL